MSEATGSSATAEIEATLSRLSGYKNVMGIMVMTRAGGVLRQSGSAFEGDKGKTYARVVVKMIESVIKGIEELEEGDSLKFLRMRTKKHELIISPDEKYFLVVLQDPN